MRLVILKKRAEFQRIRGGQRWSGKGFLAEGKPRENRGIATDWATDGAAGGAARISGPRFGFTVSKKVGNAVERNRIKRRLKEALRLIPVELAPPQSDIVIVARRPSIDMAFDVLRADLEAALKRLAQPAAPTTATRRKKPSERAAVKE